jgi:hypothetical protein
MANTTQTSDRSLGLSLTFGIVTVVATILMAATSYLYALNGDAGMRTLSGLAFAAAMLAAGLAVAAFHLFGER